MIKQIRQKDPRTGITYVYEAEIVWDKEKKQSRYASRKMLGHLDDQTGEIVENRPRRQKAEAPQSRRLFAGATHLLTELARETGVRRDLALALQSEDAGTAVESFAQFLIAEEPAPASRFPLWSRTHIHPLGMDLASQRWSELFASIGQPEVEAFFRSRVKRASGQYWFFDTTSVSSYSRYLERVRWGKNKDGVALPQINLAVVKDAGTGLPVAFKDLPGNLSDVSLVKQLIADFSHYGAGRMKLVMDRGFYSKANIDELMGEHLKFLIGVKTGLSYVRHAIETYQDQVKGWEQYDSDREVFGLRIDHPWEWERAHPRTETQRQTKRSYLYLYYDPDRAKDDEKDFAALLRDCWHELTSGDLNEKHQHAYTTYFHQVNHRWTGTDEAIAATRDHHGWFALLSNDASLDCWTALDLYRSKDQIEKAFHDVKDRLDFRTTAVHNQESLTGKLFTVFTALIVAAELRRRMHESGLDRDYTVTELLDELDTIEQYQSEGHRPVIPHITAKQKDIYTRLNVQPPTTS